MIESVKARQRGAFNFEDHYDNLCALQDSAPLDAVKANLAKGILDLNGDRIRCSDWQPIINTIKINKSLQFIAIRSTYQVPVIDDEKRLAILRRKLPAIKSKEITHRLMKALKDCLSISPGLSGIELQGLSLRVQDILVLLKGVLKSKSLRHMSLENCRLGDDGFEVLCRGLKNTKLINSINLSGCGISSSGAESLAGLIKHQGVQRHNEAWQDSLRYRRPELDRMSGIRRITANNNPLLGDEGVSLLADALKDDLWLKALDLQACGISNSGAKTFLGVLKYNTTLVVLDIRRNPLIERSTLHSLMEQLMLNSNGEDKEYKWMSADEQQETAGKKPNRSRRRTTKILNNSLGKKTTIKSSKGSKSCSCCGQVTPASSRCKYKICKSSTRKFEVPASPGFPWRTAARANRFRGHPPDTPRYYAETSTEGVFVENDENISNNFAENDVVAKPRIAYRPDSSSRMKRVKAETAAAMKQLEESHMSLDLTNHKEVQIELEQMRRHLKEERLARARSDQQVITLMIENRKLTEEITQLKTNQKFSKSILDEDSFLDSVETAFKQFHAFLDMLREAGLGQLVTMAGLDQTQMPFYPENNNKMISSNFSPIVTANTNMNNRNTSWSGKNGIGVSHTQPAIPTTVTTSTTAGYDGTFKNLQLDPSTFLNVQQKPIEQSTPKTTLLSNKDVTVVQDDDIRSKTSHSSVYDEKSEIARQEADELYSRLLKESRIALGQEVDVFDAGAHLTRSDLTESKQGHLSGHIEGRESKRLTTIDNFEDRLSSLRGDSLVVDVASSNDDSEEDAALNKIHRQSHGLEDDVETALDEDNDF